MSVLFIDKEVETADEEEEEISSVKSVLSITECSTLFFAIFS